MLSAKSQSAILELSPARGGGIQQCLVRKFDRVLRALHNGCFLVLKSVLVETNVQLVSPSRGNSVQPLLHFLLFGMVKRAQSADSSAPPFQCQHIAHVWRGPEHTAPEHQHLVKKHKTASVS